MVGQKLVWTPIWTGITLNGEGKDKVVLTFFEQVTQHEMCVVGLSLKLAAFITIALDFSNVVLAISRSYCTSTKWDVLECKNEERLGEERNNPKNKSSTAVNEKKRTRRKEE